MTARPPKSLLTPVGHATRAAIRARPLLPTGTARAQFLGPGAAASDEALPRALWEQLAAHDVGEDVLLAAWEASRWAATAPVADRRAFACLIVALGEATAAGDTFLALGAGLTAWLARLGLGDADRRAAVALAGELMSGRAPPAISALCGIPGSRRPFIVVPGGGDRGGDGDSDHGGDGDRGGTGDGALYPERLWSYEDHLATDLAARLSRAVPARGPADADDARAAVRADPRATPLSDEQAAALGAALARPLTLVTGGPGTGKTSIVVALLRVLARLGVTPDRVAVAAPTGRAAQRIDESVRAALGRLSEPVDVDLRARFAGASTLHRLLGVGGARLRGLEPDAPTYHAGWRLPHRVVIVDEASMIDLFLMSQLVSALADDARLILLGDADQLPSVRPGAVFRDLGAALPDLTCRLTQSHRMNAADPGGAEILRVAGALNAGGADIPVRARAADLRGVGVEHLSRDQLPDFVDHWYRAVLGGDAIFGDALDHRFTPGDGGRLLPSGDRDDGGDERDAVLRRLLTAHAAARILCVTRAVDRAAGADAINALLHARARRGADDRGRGDATAASARFLPGEPVTVLRNDYQRGLWNGDQGVVIRTTGPNGDRLAVAFARADAIVAHPLDHLGDNLALAFALTVHKAQGSEYDRVALILPDADGPLLAREILYTALTRARHAVTVVGDPALFALGAGRRQDRASGLREKLRPK